VGSTRCTTALHLPPSLLEAGGERVKTEYENPESKMTTEPYLGAVQAVTNARPGIRQSIRLDDPDLVRLLDSPACNICIEFHMQYASHAIPCEDEQEAKYRGGILLFTMAALQCGEFAEEQLILQGARGVAAAGVARTNRLRKAAFARPKRLKNVPWYVTHHLGATQEQLASELRALCEHPGRLREVLGVDGERALARHM
jgi:hypothetical protein